MARHGNILSFDEARRRGSVSSKQPQVSSKSTTRSNVKSRRSPATSHVAQPTRTRVAPERLTFDETFEQSFTATSRSGSYRRSNRDRSSVPTDPFLHAARNASAADSLRESREDMAANPSNTQRSQSSRQSAEESKDKKSLSHRMRSAKAERQFNRTFGKDDGPKAAPEEGSRPALYKMQMGKTHKRSSRMQSPAASKKRGGLFGRLAGLFAIFDPRSARFSSRALITCATLLLAVIMLYQPVANYYQEIRAQQQLEAEYAVVADYYSSLKSEVEYLNTKEGREEYVHQELGWVKPGEHVVSVEGLEPRDATSKKGSITSDLSNAVPTPDTWYSPVLDVVLGYNKP